MTNKPKRGDVREDGMIYWFTQSSGAQWWVTPEKFLELKAYMKRYAKGYSYELTEEQKQRDRERALERYRRIMADPEAKAKEYAKDRARHKERIATDPAYREQHRARARRAYKSRAERGIVREKNNRRYRSDPMHALRMRTGHRARQFLFRKKGNRESDVLCCRRILGRAFIEAQFKPGMDWANYGKWHMDHFIPLTSARDADSLIPLYHYTNVQPIWAIDNVLKSNKIPTPQEQAARDEWVTAWHIKNSHLFV